MTRARGGMAKPVVFSHGAFMTQRNPIATQHFSRRWTLSLAASGLGALALGACSDDDAEASSPASGGGGGGGSAGAGGSGPMLGEEDFKRLACDNQNRVLSPNAGLLTPADFDRVEVCAMKASPSSIEGPYFYCVDQPESEIAQGLPGTPLVFGFRVLDAASCQPLPDAVVDVWHCDVHGAYAGYDVDPDVEATRFSHREPAHPDATACRGVQRSDQDGIVSFKSIFPGWYAGRAVHAHFKVNVQNRDAVVHQLMFDQDIWNSVQRGNDVYSDEGRKGRKVQTDQDPFQDRFTLREKNGLWLALSTVYLTA